MSERSICLLGRDYPELGPLGLASFPDGGALALTRGELAKSYRHQDPNEDGALIVQTERGVLLAVADGYNGVQASEAALGVTRDRAVELVAESEQAFRAEVMNVVAAVSARLRTSTRSRTCLVVASLRGRHCDVACFGDSSLFRANQIHPVTPANDLVLGRSGLSQALDRSGQSEDLPLDLWYVGFELEAGERVALVTDGVTNFVRRLSHIPKLISEAANDVEAAASVARAAMQGGAGDNIAVATIASTGQG